MNDEKFDELARKALAFDPGSASEYVWNRAKPAPLIWFPTVREMLACGCAAALILLGLGLNMRHGSEPSSEPNIVIEKVIHDESNSIVASVTRIDYPAIPSVKR